MFRSLHLSGAEAQIRWGYHSAARLGAWTLSAKGSTGTLTATVADADQFKCAQPNLQLRIPRQTGSWTYPILSLHIVDRALTATVDLQG